MTSGSPYGWLSYNSNIYIFPIHSESNLTRQTCKFLERKVQSKQARGQNSLVPPVSHRLAVSERALPTQIPPNPGSVAAECVVPPGETLPEGLITEHPVCAKAKVTAEVPAAQWLCCLTRFCPRRCDAVHKPGTPSACSPQLLLSFAATTVPFQPSVCSSWLSNYPRIGRVGGLTKCFFKGLNA